MMKTGVGSDTAKSARALAQQVARQMAQEPLEVLKTVREQVGGEETVKPSGEAPQQDSSNQNKILEHRNELQDKIKSNRMMEAFQKELDDIRKQKVFKDLQSKISQGIDVYLEDYPELSMEQRQVLKAQIEAVKFQKKQAEYVQANEGFAVPKSRKGRKMGQGQKQEAEKQQTHVEKPVPPSG